MKTTGTISFSSGKVMRCRKYIFNYIKYDEISTEISDTIRKHIEEIIFEIDYNLCDSREHELAITSLEESFMWIGKAIKVNQLTEEERKKN